MVDDYTVADSTRAVLVWEPRRVLPSYAFPVEELRAELVASAKEAEEAGDTPHVLHGGIPFSVHSTEGEPLDVQVGGKTLPGAAFRPADPKLAGFAVLDFHAFDAWYEEEEPIVSHPRDPFHRVDIRRSSRHVRIEVDGHVLAESSRPTLLFETSLPTRYYLPREDVRVDLRPSDKLTYCAYKGEASYWSPEVGGRVYENLLWGYEDPLPDAPGLADLVVFFNEKVDVIVDGERQERPETPLSTSILAEAGV